MSSEKDAVDRLLNNWTRERPDLEIAGLGVVNRIWLLAKHLTRRDRRALERLGLAPWAFEVLAALRRQGPPYRLSPTGLGRRTLLSSGAMTTRLDRLQDAGYVRRIPDPHDRRGVLIEITESGQELADRAIEARLVAVEALLAPLDDADREALARLLRKMLAPLDHRTD